MEVKILSREAAVKIMKEGFLKNTAMICFYAPDTEPLDYYRVCDEAFYGEAPDIDFDSLEEYGYSYENFFEDADELAQFIKKMDEKGYDFICQCEYGQSRSVGCATAIKKYFSGRGIDVFADFDYYPSKLIYNKLIRALKK